MRERLAWKAEMQNMHQEQSARHFSHVTADCRTDSLEEKREERIKK